jgi:glycosyltransferase involved in cell wall biosynthesis
VVTAVKRIYEDRNLRNKLISNGYKIVGSRFDVKREVLQTEQIYKKILVNEF